VSLVQGEGSAAGRDRTGREDRLTPVQARARWPGGGAVRREGRRAAGGRERRSLASAARAGTRAALILEG